MPAASGQRKHRERHHRRCQRQQLAAIRPSAPPASRSGDDSFNIEPALSSIANGRQSSTCATGLIANASGDDSSNIATGAIMPMPAATRRPNIANGENSAIASGNGYATTVANRQPALANATATYSFNSQPEPPPTPMATSAPTSLSATCRRCQRPERSGGDGSFNLATGNHANASGDDAATAQPAPLPTPVAKAETTSLATGRDASGENGNNVAIGNAPTPAATRALISRPATALMPAVTSSTKYAIRQFRQCHWRGQLIIPRSALAPTPQRQDCMR